MDSPTTTPRPTVAPTRRRRSRRRAPPTPRPTLPPPGDVVTQPAEGCPEPTKPYGKTTCCCGNACCWNRCTWKEPPVAKCLVGSAAGAVWKMNTEKGWYEAVIPPTTPKPTVAPARRRRRRSPPTPRPILPPPGVVVTQPAEGC